MPLASTGTGVSSNGLNGYFPGRRARQRFVPPMFLTVPPIPALRMALTALPMSFCGTCSTFCGARLFFRRWAAACNPAAEPLRSTSVARPPPLVRASRRCLPRKGTSVLPPGPAARFLARRWAGVSGIVRIFLSSLVGIPHMGDLKQQEPTYGIMWRECKLWRPFRAQTTCVHHCIALGYRLAGDRSRISQSLIG